ncbi:hypothetical protein AGOR_G00045600 [Albula goreensis]|uniref:Transcription termination factor 3, mitochondrial n=1 Tax=Albula goreensis TaxID=1534307 RepID=A0A8T3E1G8_9TELE|nr:hypothetical protein AGOR_G00045600 [Albula goreensis]
MASVRVWQRCSGLLLSRTVLSVPVPNQRLRLILRGSTPLLLSEQSRLRAFALSHAAGQNESGPSSPTANRLVPNRALTEPLPVLEDLDGAPPLSPFEELSEEEAVQIVATPPLPPVSTSLRDYVAQSETLSALVQLGVNLSKLDHRPNVGSMLLRLDLQQVQERLLFLRDLGLQDSDLGPLITRNPFILTETLENLRARVSYLQSRRFSVEAVGSMVRRAPYLLNFSVQRLDNRLGFLQKELGLSPHKTRDIVTRLPRLVCGSLEPVKENLRVYELELGFRPNEIQHIVTRIPKLLTANKRRLTETFDYIHNTMAVPHMLIVKFPQVLNTSLLRIKERHLFLQHLGKAQYDPTLPGYISLDQLAALPDPAFCAQLAAASLEDFELFQKML